jgi:hypothetical protein
VPFGGFLLMLIAGAVIGVGVGLLLWAVETYVHIYLIILFPIIAGAIVGGVLAWAVRSSKVRSPLIAALIGLAAALVAYGTYHFAGYYITFRGDMRAAYIENSGRTPTDAQLDDELNELMQDEVGDSGFLGYLRVVAREGFSISRTGVSTSSNAVDLEGDIVWAYWAVELLVIVGFGAILPARAAGEPFDEDDNVWYGKPTLIGITTGKARKDLLRALENGDFQGAGRMLTTQNIKYPRTEVMLRRSPAANTMPQDVFVTIHQSQRQGRSTVVKSGILSPTELNWLTGAMEGRSHSSVPDPSYVSAPSDIFEL